MFNKVPKKSNIEYNYNVRQMHILKGRNTYYPRKNMLLWEQEMFLWENYFVMAKLSCIVLVFIIYPLKLV